MRKYGKIDANQPEIVKDLLDIGASVVSVASHGDGLPDVLVGFRGVNYLMEIKQPGEELTPKEVIFHDEWRGEKSIVYTSEDAYRVIGAI